MVGNNAIASSSIAGIADYMIDLVIVPVDCSSEALRAEMLATGVVPPELGIAEGEVHVDDIELFIRLAIERAGLSGEAFGVDQLIYQPAGVADASSEALSVRQYLRMALGMAESKSLAEGVTLFISQPLTVAELSAAGIDIERKVKGKATRDVSVASLSSLVEADAIEAVYVIFEEPHIIADRNPDSAVIEVTNVADIDRDYGLTLFRSDKMSGAPYYRVQDSEESPIVDTGLDPEKNYRYKVAFSVDGERGGQPYVVDGKRSRHRYAHRKVEHEF